MRETIELRIPEQNAERYLPDGVGVSLGREPTAVSGKGADFGVRKVTLAIDDPLLSQIGRLSWEFRARGEYFFLGWSYHRRYTTTELEAAELVSIYPGRTFEPAGEECGTRYDDSIACPDCGAGAPQMSPLSLDGRRIPKGPDFAVTIADEWVLSARAVDVFRDIKLRGARFAPIRLANRGGAESHDSFQLQISEPYVELDGATGVGSGPFDTDPDGRCPRGDLVGLNLLSEVSVKRGSLTAADIFSTKQMVGVRRGLLRPRRITLLSPRAWRAVRNAGLKGLIIEVAHVM